MAAGNPRQVCEEPLALPGDSQAKRCAYAAAGLGGANLITLGLMYAIEVPRNGPYVFGAINDFGSGLYFLSSIRSFGRSTADLATTARSAGQRSGRSSARPSQLREAASCWRSR